MSQISCQSHPSLSILLHWIPLVSFSASMNNALYQTGTICVSGTLFIPAIFFTYISLKLLKWIKCVTGTPRRFEASTFVMRACLTSDCTEGLRCASIGEDSESLTVINSYSCNPVPLYECDRPGPNVYSRVTTYCIIPVSLPSIFNPILE